MTEQFAKIPISVIGDERLGHAAFRTLCALASFANGEKCCWQFTKTLAQRAGMSQRSVIAQVRILEQLGYVVSERQKRGDGGFGANYYRVFFPSDHSPAPVVMSPPHAANAAEVVRSAGGGPSDSGGRLCTAHGEVMHGCQEQDHEQILSTDSLNRFSEQRDPSLRSEPRDKSADESDAFKLKPEILPPKERPATRPASGNLHHANGAHLADLDSAIDAAELMTTIWNEECAGRGLLGRAMKPSRTRQAICLKRWREDFESSADAWRAYCRRIAASPHLRGENDRGWRADIDWVLEPRHLAHIMEGRYDHAEIINGAHNGYGSKTSHADAVFAAAVAAGDRFRAHNDRR